MSTQFKQTSKQAAYQVKAIKPPLSSMSKTADCDTHHPQIMHVHVFKLAICDQMSADNLAEWLPQTVVHTLLIINKLSRVTQQGCEVMHGHGQLA